MFFFTVYKHILKIRVSNEYIILLRNFTHCLHLRIAGGDRGGVADLILSIKVSKMPIICICNDKYKQSLKSLRNHCMEMEFRKPTKQQVAQRLNKICQAEGLAINSVRQPVFLFQPMYGLCPRNLFICIVQEICLITVWRWSSESMKQQVGHYLNKICQAEGLAINAACQPVFLFQPMYRLGYSENYLFVV